MLRASMESMNESFSRNKPCIRTRLGDRMDRLSSVLHSFWMSFSCLFHFECFYHSVEVQTEEDVVRFIAMSLRAAENGETPAGDNEDSEGSVECGGAFEVVPAATTPECISRNIFADLRDNFSDRDVVKKNHAFDRQFRFVDYQDRHPKKCASFFSSLAQENSNDLGQRNFHCAAADFRSSPLCATVSLLTCKTNNNAMTQTSGNNAVFEDRYVVEKGDFHGKASDSEERHHVLSAKGNICQVVLKGKSELDLADCRPVESKSEGEACDSDGDGDEVPQLKCRAEKVEKRWNDEDVITALMEAEPQAKMDIAGCAENQIEAVCKLVQTERGMAVGDATSYCNRKDQREGRKRFRWIRKLFRRRV